MFTPLERFELCFQVDVHVAHFHGLVGVDNAGSRTDSIRLIPGSTSAVNIIVDVPGTWLFHCHINDHIQAGMQALFHVSPDTLRTPTPTPSPTRQRFYYIQAEEVVWDYAPKRRNVCDNSKFGPDERIFTETGIPILSETGNITGYTIGSTYMKTRYVQYTDATFTARVERDEHSAHLGLMGPVIRARVGEEIVIHFRNNGSEPVSLHPHGVRYDKASEGAPYNDGTPNSLKKDDIVEFGETYVYHWLAVERAGPGPGERKAVKMWMYHGHQNEILDTYTGLFGVIVVVGKDANEYDNETLLPLDGSKEVFLYMSVMNEALNFHFRENIRKTRGNEHLSEHELDLLIENESFQESNLMHSINGYVYCNGPIVKIPPGRATRFYMYTLGSEGKFSDFSTFKTFLFKRLFSIFCFTY